MFDEGLLTNEDYEFNARVRKTGKQVWLDPRIRSIYFARPTLGALAKQYWRYGFWKWRMLRRHPETVRWRQVIPPVFVASVIIFSLLAFWLPACVLLAAEVFLYALILFSAGIQQAARRGHPALALGFPLAVGAIHFSWGGGFLWSLVQPDGGRHG